MGKKFTGEYLICETCLKEFYVPKARIDQAKRNNCRIRFCSVKCYDKAGEKNPNYGNHKKLGKCNNTFPKGELNPQFIKCKSSDYIGKTIGWWRRFLMNKFHKCQKCDFPDERILQLHHLDYNRKNNVGEN